MFKILAVVLILSSQSVLAAPDVAFKSLRLQLWYQGLEASSDPVMDLLEEKAVSVKNDRPASELLELAHKFSNSQSRLSK